MSLFDDEFIDNLPGDPKIALFEICSHYMGRHAEKSNKPFGIDEHLEAYALLRTFVEENQIDNDVNVPPLPVESDSGRMSRIHKIVMSVRSNLLEYVEQDTARRKLGEFSKRFKKQLRGAFRYEFTEGDLEQVQNLLNELREFVMTSDFFEENHRRRLLKRIERLQSELHKRLSDLDHFWGLVGDAGVALGKFGNDAKPIVDRIREIADIVWRTQSRAEELPSDSKPALSLDGAEDDKQ